MFCAGEARKKSTTFVKCVVQRSGFMPEGDSTVMFSGVFPASPTAGDMTLCTTVWLSEFHGTLTARPFGFAGPWGHCECPCYND